MIYFALVFLLGLVLLGIIISKNRKDVCTYCLGKFRKTTQINDQVSLCSKHFQLYRTSNLKPFLCVKCSSLNDENGIYLYNMSQSLKEKSIYNHIISEYNLNKEEIETIQTLYKHINN